jgi:hypothetical protein
MRLLHLLTFLLFGLGLVGGAAAECGPELGSTREYVREHTVHHFNGDPPSQEKDTLVLWESSTGELCFDLDTWGPNGHECGAQGTLKALPSGKLLFELGVCTLTIEQAGNSLVLTASPGWERVGAGGVCPRLVGCGAFGSVESGKFVSPGE